MAEVVIRNNNVKVYVTQPSVLESVQVIQGPSGPQGLPGADGVDGTNGADGVVQSIVAGSNITVDSTDPANPVVSSSGGGGTAASTTFTPVGNIAATDVQAALQEVDSEKETPAGATSKANSAVSTHVAATDPHGDRAYADGLRPAGLVGEGYVNAEESTTSLSYVNLTTVGASVTFTAKAGVTYLIIAVVDVKVAAGGEGRVSFAVSGANTLTEGDGPCVSVTSTAYQRSPLAYPWKATSSGSTTVTLKYRSGTGNTATFRRRYVSAVEV